MPPTQALTAGAEERADASLRQLEALTALAAAPSTGRDLEEICAGLADTITGLTDYRSCLVVLLSDEEPYRPRVLSHSSNVPREYAERIASGPYPRERVARLVERGVRIEAGELGYAAYFPPSHYHLLDSVFPERYKAELPRSLPPDGEHVWHEGDELFVPLFTHEREFVGFVSLDDPRSGRAPDRRGLLPALAFARQTAQLVARRRDDERLVEQARREALVNRITRAVRQTLDTDQIFRAAVDELGLHLDVDRCVLFMLDTEAGVARNVAEYLAPGVTGTAREFKMPVVAGAVRMIREHGALAFEDVEHDPSIRDLYENALSGLGTRSLMLVSIRVGDQVPAAFALSMTRERRRWRHHEIALARAVADQTGIAIRQAELYERAERTSAREALVNRLSHAVRASLNLPDVLRAATHELGQALRASRVYLRPYDPDRPEVSPVMYEYLAEGCETAAGVNLSYNDPVGSRMVGAPRTLVIHDAEDYEGATPEIAEHLRDLSGRHGAPSKIICPLIVQGHFRGALCIHQADRVRHWAADEVTLVESVAAQLATGIAQAELFEMVERAKRTWEVTFDALSDGIFIFSNDRRLLRVNRAGAAMEARAPQELLGRRCCDILRAGRGEGCIVERAAAQERSITLEYTPERLGRPLLVTAEPVVEDSGQVGTVCTVRDLSELRRVETLARERQSLLEHVLESARETICAVDPDGHILWLNSAATGMNGYPKDQLIRMHFLELVAEEDREMVVERFRRSLAGEPQTIELRIVTREGQVRHVVSDTTPIRIDGRTTGVLSITRDVTEQRQERERAAQADKLRALGQLASGVAHDFNNALAAILGRAQLLRRATQDAEVVRNLEIIQTAAEDAAATVRRIRSFAHQSPGEEFSAVEVGALLRDAVEITRTRWENDARARGLSYDVRLEADCELHARGNASELREVFVNLIVNAIDAMPAGGRLRITCGREGDRIRLLFTDTGAGMPEDVRARIFEPFYTTKGAQGTGLGLFVSYGIVERHGGYIEVASGPGRGTTFVIVLPHAPRAEQRAGDGARHVPAAGAGSLSVLVVDDESAVRETLSEMVEALGHRVTAAGGGREALRTLASEAAFDLVFTDLSMPGMDGWELAREVRRLSPRTRVCIVTGYGKDTPRPARGDDPADVIIGKPFDFRQVEEVLTRFGSVHN
ncbi:MAG TPA: GAF domain-containing protein [Pyrinomonadaceae bacterium]|nr:GAF domain-containing protein [Pyrinomonadaceae bacterium]